MCSVCTHSSAAQVVGGADTAFHTESKEKGVKLLEGVSSSKHMLLFWEAVHVHDETLNYKARVLQASVSKAALDQAHNKGKFFSQ